MVTLKEVQKAQGREWFPWNEEAKARVLGAISVQLQTSGFAQVDLGPYRAVGHVYEIMFAVRTAGWVASTVQEGGWTSVRVWNPGATVAPRADD